jgi:multidrug transporter EmrE-like cation transporter
MKLPLYLYLVGRALKGLAIGVTMPLWLPCALILLVVCGLFEAVVDTYLKWTNDWKNYDRR